MMGKGPWWRIALLPLTSSLLLILAQPPFTLQPLPFLALVPLLVGMGHLPPGLEGGRQATLAGLVFGLGFWGISLVWILTEVAPTFSWALPGFALLLLILGGLSALFVWLVHRLSRGEGLSLALAVPLAWVGVEWLKAHFPFGLAFPWLGLGVTLTGRPELLGLAEWTGEAGVAFWLAGVNGLVARVLLAPGPSSPARRLVPWLVVAAVVTLPAAAGLLRARSLESELVPGPRVAVVGTEVPRALRSDPGAYASRAVLEALEADRRYREAPPDPARRALASAVLVVLPEATVPMPFREEEARLFRENLADWAGRLESHLLLGAQARASEGEEDVTNAAFVLSPAGAVGGRYDKVRLVPAMEGGYLSGEGAGVLAVNGLRVGPLLCYESLFGALARKARLQGAELLVNLSSDVWFGEGSSGIRSLFLYQHPAHLVLRAVENRTPVARAANGGFTLFLDPLGRRVGPSWPPGEGPGLLVQDLPVVGGMTLYTRTGDCLGPLCLLICAALLARGLRREGSPAA